MITYDTKNCVKGPKVHSKLRGVFYKEVWKHLLLKDRNFMSSLKNYYEVNGFLTLKQYKYLEKFYNDYVDKFTEVQENKGI